MAQAVAVIVTGLPGTGKTSFSHILAAELHMPVFSKDGIKEILFDHLGWSDPAWSRKLGGASSAILLHVLEAQVKAGGSCIVENAFHTLYTEQLRGIHRRCSVDFVQIYLTTVPSILEARLRQRFTSGERHPGHPDHTVFEDLPAVIASGTNAPLELPGVLITVDTTDFARIDYAALLAQIAPLVARP